VAARSADNKELIATERDGEAARARHQSLLPGGGYADNVSAAWNTQYVFPRWDERGGIPIRPLLRLIRGIVSAAEEADGSGQRRGGGGEPLLTRTLRWKAQWRRFPELLYMMDGRGAWASQALRNRTTWRHMIAARYRPTESQYAGAGTRLLASVQEAEEKPAPARPSCRSGFQNGSFEHDAVGGSP
jgi:hypothetical protein